MSILSKTLGVILSLILIVILSLFVYILYWIVKNPMNAAIIFSFISLLYVIPKIVHNLPKYNFPNIKDNPAYYSELSRLMARDEVQRTHEERAYKIEMARLKAQSDFSRPKNSMWEYHYH